MTLDVVNDQNEKVGSLELRDEVFGGRVNADLIWQSVVRSNAGDRRGTHATKTRGMVSGTGKKPYKQKGTGRAQVGEARNPLWRKGGTVFGPQPRSYEQDMPRKAERGALLAALSAKLQAGRVTIVAELGEPAKTKLASEMLQRLGAAGPTLIIDVKPTDGFTRAVRNLPGVQCVPSGRLVARDLMNCQRVVATRAAVERLQEVLGS
jgi:large subunit ribosomal protein L4